MVGCGTAQNGFIADNNSCFPDYNALGTANLVDPVDTELAASDGTQATAAQKFTPTASSDVWGVQLRVLGNTEEIDAEFDLVLALESGETATNAPIPLPDGSEGDILSSGNIVPGQISLAAGWVDFKLGDYVSITGGRDYWILLYPTVGNLSWTISTSSDGSYSSHDGTDWATDTASDAAYSLIKCQILVPQ